MGDSGFVRIIGPKPRACGCKGIRSCTLCKELTNDRQQTLAPERTFSYCIDCKKAWHIEPTSPQQNSDSFNKSSATDKCVAIDIHNNGTSVDTCPANGFIRPGECPNAKLGVIDDVIKSTCSHVNASHVIDFEGIAIIENFITEEEEEFLNTAISSCQFVNSQSGRRKQDYGPKVNFKKQKLRTANFNGLPSYSRFIYERMKAHPYLCDFEPVELCNLEYCQQRGAHIDAHLDDMWLWGDRLVTLNLLSDSVLTFTLDSNPGVSVGVPLFRRSLTIVSSAARDTWKHSILPEDIKERRIAMTFRELSTEFTAGGVREQEGNELLKVALLFEGKTVNS
uniref:Fe2OG dioxygenase domain-containing protein n=2 Tax=Arion vulgaris TaxID=1028688 RepID=A0A0B6ZEX2_9EUPU